MLNLIRREPALVTGFVLALIGVVAAFGLHVSDDQKAAIVSLVGSVLAILGAAHVRSQVTPVPKPVKGARRAEAGAMDPIYALVVVILVIVLVWLLMSVVH